MKTFLHRSAMALASTGVVATLIMTTAGGALASGPTTATNTVVSVNQNGHNTTVLHAHGMFKQLYGHSVSATNTATATTQRCNSCRTAAVAFLVVAAPEATDVNAVNTATTFNIEDSNSVTFAAAYEWVVVGRVPGVQRAVIGYFNWLLTFIVWKDASDPTQLQADLDNLAGHITDLLTRSVRPAPQPTTVTPMLSAPETTSSPAVIFKRSVQTG